MRTTIILAGIMGIYFMVSSHVHAYPLTVSWQNAASEGVSVYYSDLSFGWIDTTNSDWSNSIVSMEMSHNLRFEFASPVKDVIAKVRFGYDFGNFIGYAPALLEAYGVNNDFLGSETIKTYRNQLPVDLFFASLDKDITSFTISTTGDDCGVYVGDITLNAPEPATVVLFNAGLVTIILLRKKVFKIKSL